MGACTFYTDGWGDTPFAAFRLAVDMARHREGNEGYTGTIAEKNEFVMITDTAEEILTRLQADLDCHYPGLVEELKKFPNAARPRAEALICLEDDRTRDKWGPAGCIAKSEGEYLFFGWASS